MEQRMGTAFQQRHPIGRVLGATAIAFSVLLGTLPLSQPAAGAEYLSQADFHLSAAAEPDLVPAGFKKKYHYKKSHGFKGYQGNGYFSRKGFGYGKRWGHRHHGLRHHGYPGHVSKRGHRSLLFQEYFGHGSTKFVYRY